MKVKPLIISMPQVSVRPPTPRLLQANAVLSDRERPSATVTDDATNAGAEEARHGDARAEVTLTPSDEHAYA